MVHYTIDSSVVRHVVITHSNGWWGNDIIWFSTKLCCNPVACCSCPHSNSLWFEWGQLQYCPISTLCGVANVAGCATNSPAPAVLSFRLLQRATNENCVTIVSIIIAKLCVFSQGAARACPQTVAKRAGEVHFARSATVWGRSLASISVYVKCMSMSISESLFAWVHFIKSFLLFEIGMCAQNNV